MKNIILIICVLVAINQIDTKLNPIITELSNLQDSRDGGGKFFGAVLERLRATQQFPIFSKLFVESKVLGLGLSSIAISKFTFKTPNEDCELNNFYIERNSKNNKTFNLVGLFEGPRIIGFGDYEFKNGSGSVKLNASEINYKSVINGTVNNRGIIEFNRVNIYISPEFTEREIEPSIDSTKKEFTDEDVAEVWSFLGELWSDMIFEIIRSFFEETTEQEFYSVFPVTNNNTMPATEPIGNSSFNLKRNLHYKGQNKIGRRFIRTSKV